MGYRERKEVESGLVIISGFLRKIGLELEPETNVGGSGVKGGIFKGGCGNRSSRCSRIR